MDAGYVKALIGARKAKGGRLTKTELNQVASGYLQLKSIFKQPEENWKEQRRQPQLIKVIMK